MAKKSWYSPENMRGFLLILFVRKMLGKIQIDEIASGLHSGKLTWLAGKWTRIEGVFPDCQLKMGKFHCRASLPKGSKGYIHMSVVLRKKLVNWSYLM